MLKKKSGEGLDNKQMNQEHKVVGRVGGYTLGNKKVERGGRRWRRMEGVKDEEKEERKEEGVWKG